MTVYYSKNFIVVLNSLLKEEYFNFSLQLIFSRFTTFEGGMLYIVLMKLPLPCYTYAALSIPFLLFPFHFIQFIQISTDCQLHCFAHTNTRDFSVTKNFIWYIYTYMHIYIYTCMYTWNLSEHFFPKHSCSKCNIKYSSVYQLLL